MSKSKNPGKLREIKDKYQHNEAKIRVIVSLSKSVSNKNKEKSITSN